MDDFTPIIRISANGNRYLANTVQIKYIELAGIKTELSIPGGRHKFKGEGVVGLFCESLNKVWNSH